MRKSILLLGVLLFSLQAVSAAEILHCNACRKRIRNRYIKGSDGNAYCGEECADKTLLPKCGNCTRPVRRWMVLPTAYGKFIYCNDCWNLSKCFLCSIPGSRLHKLPNGNFICRYCNKDIVRTLPELQKIFDAVRRDLTRKFNFEFKHQIKLEMRSFSEAAEWDTSREFGLYKYHGQIITTEPGLIGKWRKQKSTVRFENESCTIIVMDYLPHNKAAEVIAHELAHEYMKHRWYFIKSDLLKEGFAELIAAEYNRYCGNERWNYRMELNPDKIYGDGYRLMRSYWQNGSWQEIYRQLDKANLQDMPPEFKQK